jgi:exo-beta-1,3-glucanase (GH17 family)
MRYVLAALLSLLLAPPVGADPVCAVRREAEGRLARLQEAMALGRFIAYQPTSLQVLGGRLTQADDASIRADLETLRPHFDALITYGALNGAERIPEIAQSLGYRAVIVGVWEPDNREEIANALAAARRFPELVVGLSLGNEMVFGRRADWAALAAFVEETRREASDLPLTVTEPFAQFLDEPVAAGVLARADFMLVNIHPVFEPWFRDAQAPNWADFVAQVGDRLAGIYCGPILVKETGVPTGPASLRYSAAMQRDFYRSLERRLPPGRNAAFAYFAAFDAPWRVADFNPVPGVHPEEAFWGLYTEGRVPKPVINGLAPLDKSR